jgi:hypothetical protein
MIELVMCNAFIGLNTSAPANQWHAKETIRLKRGKCLMNLHCEHEMVLHQ